MIFGEIPTFGACEWRIYIYTLHSRMHTIARRVAELRYPGSWAGLGSSIAAAAAAAPLPVETRPCPAASHGSMHIEAKRVRYV